MNRRILFWGGDFLSARTIKKAIRQPVINIDKLDDSIDKKDIIVINNFGKSKEDYTNLLNKAKSIVGKNNAKLAYESVTSDVYSRTHHNCRQLTTGVLSLAH